MKILRKTNFENPILTIVVIMALVLVLSVTSEILTAESVHLTIRTLTVFVLIGLTVYICEDEGFRRAKATYTKWILLHEAYFNLIQKISKRNKG